MIETKPASGPVIINKGSGFFKTMYSHNMLEKISPKEADKKVLIKINGIFNIHCTISTPIKSKPTEPQN